MNARLYDPALGRFLSPDPYVQSPDNSQNFNRYSYCLNNPLIYTDINGKSLSSWWKKNIGDPFMREWNQVFGNGFTLSLGTNTQFSSTHAVIAPNGPNGMPYGPAFGIQTNNYKTVTPVSANYQAGFFKTQPINFESNLHQSVVNAEQIARSDYFKQKIFEANNNYNAPTDFGYNLLIDGMDHMSKGVKFTGMGLTTLTNVLGGLQVYDEFKKGKINPIDATSLSFGTIGWATKALSWFGYGGKTMSFFGEFAGYGGLAITTYQLWNFIYKPMNDLNFAPLYIEDNGQPYNGDPQFDSFTNEERY